MISFIFVTSVLALQNGALLEMTGDAAKIEFGGAFTLIHNATDDSLECSGKIKASDILIEGTSTTVADLISKVASLEVQISRLATLETQMQLTSLANDRSYCRPSASPCTTSSAITFRDDIFGRLHKGETLNVGQCFYDSAGTSCLCYLADYHVCSYGAFHCCTNVHSGTVSPAIWTSDASLEHRLDGSLVQTTGSANALGSVAWVAINATSSIFAHFMA